MWPKHLGNNGLQNSTIWFFCGSSEPVLFWSVLQVSKNGHGMYIVYNLFKLTWYQTFLFTECQEGLVSRGTPFNIGFQEVKARLQCHCSNYFSLSCIFRLHSPLSLYICIYIFCAYICISLYINFFWYTCTYIYVSQNTYNILFYCIHFL